MKKLILSLTGMGVALALVFSSCQKEGLKQSTKTNSEETHLTTEVKIPNSGIEYHGDTIFPEYYLNNKRIINADYDLNLSKSTNIIVAFLDSISKKRSEEHTSELQSRPHLVCRLLLEKKNKK